MRIHPSSKTFLVSAAAAMLAVAAPTASYAGSHHGGGPGAGGHGQTTESHGAMPNDGGHGRPAGTHGGMHGASSAGHAGGHDIGEAGKASEVSRTIAVTMTDNRFEPEKIVVKKGETVRFAIVNKGSFVHEFNIGKAAMHEAHRKEMMMMFEHGVLEPDRIHRDRMKMKMPDGRTMEHNDPNSVLVEPGTSAEVIWKFSTDARLEFACNMPGHYEAGMMGPIEIQ